MTRAAGSFPVARMERSDIRGRSRISLRSMRATGYGPPRRNAQNAHCGLGAGPVCPAPELGGAEGAKAIMRLGYFTMPMHPLHRDWAETLDEDREAVLLADRTG